MNAHSALSFFSHLMPLILWGCGFLLAACFVILGKAYLEARALRMAIRKLRGRLREAHQESAVNRRGLDPEALDSLRVRMEGLDGPAAAWWKEIDGSIEQYDSPTGEEQAFLTEEPRSILPEPVVLDKHFHSRFYSIVPGLITASGLTLTFVAILMALYGVHYNKADVTEPVSGIDVLINGLSGKFLSSIVALVLSIVFTIAERMLVRELQEDYEGLLAELSSVLPVLSAKRLLLDIRKSSSDASVSVANITPEVTDRLASVINERVVPALAGNIAGALTTGLAPTMEKMTGSLEGLQGAIVGLESQKQESITGEFERMARGLQESVATVLGQMAGQFREALSGSAREEFGAMQTTMEATRVALSEVTQNFSRMQDAFQAVIDKTEESTQGHLRSGREQTEAMSAAVHSLMERMEQGTQQNLDLLHTRLAAAIDQVTSRVGQLSADMMSTASEVSHSAQRMASEMLEKNFEATSNVVGRMEGILGQMEQSGRAFAGASSTLAEARENVARLLQEAGTTLERMAEATRTVQKLTQELTTQTSSMRSTTQQHSEIVTHLRSLADTVRETSQQQGTQLSHYVQQVQGFSAVIQNLDERIEAIMRATTTGLNDYNERVRQNFDAIVHAADQLVPKITKNLSTQADQLSEGLDNLISTIERTVAANGAA